MKLLAYIKSFLFIIFIATSINSFAVNCDNIIVPNSDGKGVQIAEGMEWAVCDTDVLMNGFNLLFQTAAENSGVKMIYKVFDLPLPDSNNNFSKINSGLLYAMMMTMTTVFVIGVIVVNLAQIAVKIVTYLNSKERDGFMNKPDTWRNAGFLLAAGVMIWPVDGMMLGHVVLFGVILFAIKLSTYMLSMVLGNFLYDVSIDNSVANPDIYTREGVEFANDLVEIMVGQMQTASTLSKINSSTTEVDMNNTPDELKTVVSSSQNGVAEIWGTGEDSFPVSVADYTYNIISPSIVATFRSPEREIVHVDPYTAHAVTVKEMSDVAGASYKISSAQLVKSKNGGITKTTTNKEALSEVGEFKKISGSTKLVESFVEPKYYESDALNSVEIGVTQVSTNTKDMRMIKDIMGTGLSKELKKFSNSIATQADIQSIADKLAAKADEYVTRHEADLAAASGSKSKQLTFDDKKKIKQEYIRASQAYLLGFYDHLSSGNFKDATYAFNPKRIESIPDNSQNQLIRMLSSGQKAAFAFMRNKCTEYAFSQEYSTQLYSQVRLYEALKKSPSDNMTAHDAASNHAGQCFAYNRSGEIVLLTDERLTNRLATLLEQQAQNGKSDAELRKVITAERDNYLIQLNIYASNINKNKMEIAKFYSNVQAIIKTAGYKITNQYDQNSASIDVLTDLRNGGVAVLASYFSAVAQLSTNISNAFDSFDMSAVGSHKLDESYLIRGVSDDVDEDVQVLVKNTLVPVGLGLAAFESAESKYVAFTNDEARVATEVSEKTSELTNEIVDALLPSQEILVEGFGLDQGEDADGTLVGGLQACATTGRCYQFTQHPLITLSLFGQDIMATGIKVIILHAIFDSLTELSDSANEMIDAWGSASGQKKAASTLKIATFFSSKIISIILVLASAALAVLVPFAKVMLATGILLAYVLPLIPVVGFMLAFVMYILEAIMTIIFYPLLLSLAFIKVNSQPMLSTKKFVGIHISLLVKPVLLLVAYVVFFLMTVVSFYIVNTTFGSVLMAFSDHSVGISTIGSVIMSVATILAQLFAYYILTRILVDECIKSPSEILSYIGVTGFATQSIGDAEALIGSQAMGDKIAGVASSVSSGLTRMAKEKQYQKGASEEQERIQKLLDDNGVNVKLTDLMNKGGE